MAVPIKSGSDKLTSTDYFGTFLENMGTPAKNVTLTVPVTSASFVILTKLAKITSQPVLDLMKESQLGLIDFAEALKEMRDAGLVDMTGAPGNEVVKLTPQAELFIQNAG